MFGVQENNHKKKKKKNKKPLELVFLFSEVGCMISMNLIGWELMGGVQLITNPVQRNRRDSQFIFQFLSVSFLITTRGDKD